jgi:glycosyltransferase involved in cell wall biosynthesis
MARLNSFLFARSQSILVVSNEVAKQVRQIIGDRSPLLEFLPVYRRGEFNQVTPPNPDSSPFRILFVGRVEENKGVFDLVAIAKRFAAEGCINAQFDICGSGPAFESLQNQICEANLEPYFTLHGYCNKFKLHQMLSQAHVVIAPTRKTFIEGFCKVVVEGILAGRPVLTSAVCPASSYVPSGVVEVPPDDVQAYGDALLELYQNREFYEKKQRGCLEVQKQFYDVSKSWGSALKLSLIA